MTDAQYQLAAQLGDEATALIKWAEPRPMPGYVWKDAFWFLLNGEVVTVPKESVERSLKVKTFQSYR